MQNIEIANTELSAEEVRNIANGLPAELNIAEQLIHFMEQAPYMQSFNALWVFKHWINSNKTSLDTDLSRRLIDFWSESKIRLAHLLVLQCSDYLRLNNDSFKTWEDFVDACRKSNHKFVKANSYNGFIPLAKYSKDLIPELIQICDIEELVTPPSGKSRIKNIKEELKKLQA